MEEHVINTADAVIDTAGAVAVPNNVTPAPQQSECFETDLAETFNGIQLEEEGITSIVDSDINRTDNNYYNNSNNYDHLPHPYNQEVITGLYSLVQMLNDKLANQENLIRSLLDRTFHVERAHADVAACIAPPEKRIRKQPVMYSNIDYNGSDDDVNNKYNNKYDNGDYNYHQQRNNNDNHLHHSHNSHRRNHDDYDNYDYDYDYNKYYYNNNNNNNNNNINDNSYPDHPYYVCDNYNHIFVVGDVNKYGKVIGFHGKTLDGLRRKYNVNISVPNHKLLKYNTHIIICYDKFSFVDAENAAKDIVDILR